VDGRLHRPDLRQHSHAGGDGRGCRAGGRADGGRSLGLGIPFLLCALLLDGAQGVLRRMRRAIRYVERVSGIFMVVIGLLVASGRLQMLSQNFATQFADLSYRLEECALQLSNGEIGLASFPAA
jgi:hypothetical protein